MKIAIDTEAGTMDVQDGERRESLPLYSDRAFELLTIPWVKVGWNQKHVYTFSWMGRPIIQLPHDMVRVQEAIWRIKPDVLVETGVAHGGSLVFYASLFEAMGRGRVIGIDVALRPQNRKAIEEHPLAARISLIEGDSKAPSTLESVRAVVGPGRTAMVVLDSLHGRDHVLAELEAYADVVTPGSYLVATDGIQRDLHDVPRGKPDWSWDNPMAAVELFLRRRRDYELEPPDWPFNESRLTADVTHWPRAWLRRRAG